MNGTTTHSGSGEVWTEGAQWMRQWPAMEMGDSTDDTTGGRMDRRRWDSTAGGSPNWLELLRQSNERCGGMADCLSCPRFEASALARVEGRLADSPPVPVPESVRRMMPQDACLTYPRSGASALDGVQGQADSRTVRVLNQFSG